MLSRIEDIQNEVSVLGQKINAPKSLVAVYSVSPQNGKPHIEVIDGGYRYVTEERGVVFEEKETDCLDKLLYWVFETVTAQMAQDYECANRGGDQDPRRIIFKKQLELLGKLSSKWRLWREQDMKRTLARNPFMDNMGGSSID